MMIRVHSPKEVAGSNSGSSVALATYLDKENSNIDLTGQEHFFNNSSSTINRLEVISKLDKNTSQLTKKEAKFFMLSINPSQKECQHMAYMATGRQVDKLSDMTPKEITTYNNHFKDYVNDAMDLYAKGFNKDLNKDTILYFGKVEQERKYKGFDKDVKEGKAKVGDVKPGFQTHCHIMVSRKDITNKIKISPMANSRGNKNTLNGEKVQTGFNRKNFALESLALFDIKMEYDRTPAEYNMERKEDKEISRFSNSQYQSYIENLSKFRGIGQTDLGTNSTKEMLQLTASIAQLNPSAVGMNAKKMVSKSISGNSKDGDLGENNAKNIIKLATAIASGNPVGIAKEVVRGMMDGMSM